MPRATARAPSMWTSSSPVVETIASPRREPLAADKLSDATTALLGATTNNHRETRAAPMPTSHLTKRPLARSESPGPPRLRERQPRLRMRVAAPAGRVGIEAAEVVRIGITLPVRDALRGPHPLAAATAAPRTRAPALVPARTVRGPGRADLTRNAVSRQHGRRGVRQSGLLGRLLGSSAARGEARHGHQRHHQGLHQLLHGRDSWSEEGVGATQGMLQQTLYGSLPQSRRATFSHWPHATSL